MLTKSQVEKGVDALLGILKATSKSVSITDQPEKVDLQFTVKNVTNVKHKTIPLLLPNSLHFDTREVCIFVKDIDQKKREYEDTVEYYEDLFKQKGVTSIAKIVPVKALRTDYCMPSTRRSLAKAYDLYLADARVVGLMPNLLGKIFYAQKKTFPIPVNVTATELKEKMDAVINNSRCVMQGGGSSCSATVAHDRLTRNKIVANVQAAVSQLAEKVPGGSDNIRNMYIKTASSTAVPLYVNFGAPDNVTLPAVERKKMPVYVDEITTVENGKVLVKADGVVKVIRDKVTEEGDDSEHSDDDDDDEDKTKKPRGRKRKRFSKKQPAQNKRDTKRKTFKKARKSKSS